MLVRRDCYVERIGHMTVPVHLSAAAR
jgi:hypothetical protein